MARDIEARFWNKVDTGGSDECWPWKAAQFRSGYGLFYLNGHSIVAHRVAFELFYHKKPKECVLHKCNNKICVNPRHLYEGDRVANARDLHISGGNPNRKLSDEEVREIRRLYKTGHHRQRELATRFGCGHSSISKIVTGQGYVYVK